MTDVNGIEAQYRVETTKPQLAEAIAREFVDVVARAQRERGVAHVALTGGSMGTAFLQGLGSVDTSQVDFAALHLWWGDERFLEWDDAARNDKQALDAYLNGSSVPTQNLHRVAAPSQMSLAEAARDYAEQLRGAGDGDVVQFDVVMLGMGPDTHVASLFPGYPQTTYSDEPTTWVDDSPKPPPQRVTLTFDSLNNSREVWLMVAGADKADAVAAANASTDRTKNPAAGVFGQRRTLWWLDAAAADGLPATRA